MNNLWNVVGCSCGICCHLSSPCDKCLSDTLKANGIHHLDHIEKLKGLKNKVNGHPSSWGYSELCQAIRRIET